MRICSECGTENEQEYEYCKNCGSKLETAYNEDKDLNYGSFNGKNAGTYNQNFSSSNSGYPYIEEISGIKSDDVATFVGKKSSEILKKFSKMEICHSKLCWCWPVAVLGFLFGPIGAAIWFFYRKMYKIALILVAIGVVMSFVTGIVSSGNNEQILNKNPYEIYEKYENDDAYTFDYKGFLNEFGKNINKEAYISYTINLLVDTACLIITSLFAFYWYKKFVINKINAYRNSGYDMRYYQFGLMSIGGTSGVGTAVGILILIFAERVVSLILKFI